MNQLVIFDLDGTLLNTIADLAAAGNYALETCGFSRHPDEAYKMFVGNGVYKLIERALPKSSQDETTIQKVKAVFDTYYSAHSLDTTKPYEGVLELLEKLQRRKIHCAVASNKPHQYTKELVKLMFKDKIELAYGQRPDTPAKPNPAVVLEILEHFKCSKEDCLYIGDSDVDILTAESAGIASVGVLWGFRTEKELEGAGADWIAKDIKALEQIIFSKFR